MQVQEVLNRLQVFTIFFVLGAIRNFSSIPNQLFEELIFPRPRNSQKIAEFGNISCGCFLREYFFARIWVDIPSCESLISEHRRQEVHSMVRYCESCLHMCTFVYYIQLLLTKSMLFSSSRYIFWCIICLD